MKLYEQSILLGDYDSLSLTGVTDASAAVDNDKNTVLESTQANPTLAVDFGSGEERAASALWLRTKGYTNVAVNAGGSEVMNESIPSDGYLYHEFTEATNRRWSLDFTGTGGVYEVYLCRRLLDFDTDEKRPIRWRMPRQVGLFFRAANGSLINFQPFGFGGGRAVITLTWELLDNESVGQLFDAFEDGAERNLQFAVYPAPGERPRHFFQARWENAFNFAHDGQKVSDGQSGSAVFQERDADVPIVAVP